MQVQDTAQETRTERLIRAFMEGVEAELLEIRGRGLTPTEREEYEQIAAEEITA